MKLQTDVAPRKDGSAVTATTRAGTKYLFQKQEDGTFQCEVNDDDDIAFLLDTGNFRPVEEVEKPMATVTKLEVSMPGAAEPEAAKKIKKVKAG